MNALELDTSHLRPFVNQDEIQGLQPRIEKLHHNLESRKGPGADFLGWLHLPSAIPESLIGDLETSGEAIRGRCDAFVTIGIGGSYLGARAALDFLGDTFYKASAKPGAGPEMLFAGHNISSDYHADLFDHIRDREICLNVISKSGTTTEPAIAFRLLKELIEKKYGAAGARERIWVTTDAKKGALKQLAEEEGYKTFEIPDDVGGRFSVLTPVGLLPMAVAGINIREVVDGAKFYEEETTRQTRLENNRAYLYAALRYLLYKKGKTTELMASLHPALKQISEWWKQLAGESEGKNLKGVFPASVEYTTDLHSLGQWVQEGERTLFETFLLVESSRRQIEIPAFQNDADGLNYLAGKTLDFVNDKAYKGTAMAHLEGGVPNMTLTVRDRTPNSLGQLFYFFQRAIAMSGYLLDVNPFDQPGVELYKSNMFTLLNKPGH